MPRVDSAHATASSRTSWSTSCTTRMRDIELRDERLKKRFELPPFLKHFATNLNLLARQDKVPPVFGRDKEIQQVLEILCHRERANSVMLVGEPGVGKTAIAEGLARRIEFEPDTVPVRLRDCQIVNLQMNSMVAGTMLRGMFEDRIQNVIRELKERPNLILFVDEAHTLVGAGSALGAPSDAANIFKSVLARGEVRMIAATTLQRVQGVHPGGRGAGAALPLRARGRADDRGDAADSLQPAPAARAQLLGAPARRGDRDGARDVAALHAAPAPAGQGDRLARHRGGARRNRPALGSDAADDVVAVISHAAQIPEDMVFRDVTDRFSDIEASLSAARRRPEQRRARRGAASRAQQGSAQGRLRSAGRRAAVSRPDRRGQDGAREGGRPSSCSATRRR